MTADRTHMVAPLAERFIEPKDADEERQRLQTELFTLREQLERGDSRHLDVAARIASRLGTIHHLSGRYDEAAHLHEEARNRFVTLGREQPAALSLARQARAMAGAGAPNESWNELTALLHSHDDTIARIWRDRLLAWRAEALVALGEPEQAIADLELALFLRLRNPKDDPTLIEQGLALLRG